MQRERLSPAGTIICIAVLLVLSSTACHHADDNDVLRDAYERAAKVAAIVLKSPENALYPPYEASFVTVLPHDVYEINAYVDVPQASAENVRTSYTCTLKYTPRDKGSIWKLLGFRKRSP